MKKQNKILALLNEKYKQVYHSLSIAFHRVSHGFGKSVACNPKTWFSLSNTCLVMILVHNFVGSMVNRGALLFMCFK